LGLGFLFAFLRFQNYPIVLSYSKIEFAYKFIFLRNLFTPKLKSTTCSNKSVPAANAAFFAFA
jgi:hypothetical protein